MRCCDGTATLGMTRRAEEAPCPVDGAGGGVDGAELSVSCLLMLDQGGDHGLLNDGPPLRVPRKGDEARQRVEATW